MSGKSEGSGLLNDKGEIVREIKAEIGGKSDRLFPHGWLNGPPNHHALTPPIEDLWINQQNDGMGCPTPTEAEKMLECKNPLYDAITKLKRVK